MEMWNDQAVRCVANELVTLIERVKLKEEFWLILDASKGSGGPFDGGCLICAEGIRDFIGDGALIRIWNDKKGVTEHYGLKAFKHIYDFDGVYETGREWLRQFAREEKIPFKDLSLRMGLDKQSEIAADSNASKKIGALMRRVKD